MHPITPNLKKIFISVGEASGDLIASRVVQAILKKQKIDFVGMGGKRLEEAGCRLVQNRDLISVMGFGAVLLKLGTVLSVLNKLKLEIQKEKPDLLILVDFPGFNFKLGRWAHEQGVPVVYLVPPKVWVWKYKRIYELKQWAKSVLCILPFEESIYQNEGVNGVFVGHPGVEDLPIDLDKNSAREQLGISKDQKTVLFMLGSRQQEIDQNYDILKRFLKLNQEVLAICAAADSRLAIKIQNLLKSDNLQSRVKMVVEDSAIAMRAADAGVIKSGTSTLEAGLMNLPHVVIYRIGWWSEQLVRWVVRFPGPFALVNLALGIPNRTQENTTVAIVPEFLGHKIDVGQLISTVNRLITNDDERKKQFEYFSRLRSVFFTTRKSSEIAAEKIIEVLGD